MLKLRSIAFSLGMFAAALSSSAAAANYRDWWYDPPKDGMSIAIEEHGGKISGAWYLNAPGSSHNYLAFSGPIKGKVMTAALVRYSGSLPANYRPAAAAGTIIGTMTVTFTNDTTATFAYAFDGGAGTLNLTRNAHASLRVAGACHHASKETGSSCTKAADKDAIYEPGTMAVSANDETVTARPPDGCAYSGPFARSGTGILSPTSYACRAPPAAGMMPTAFSENAFAGAEFGGQTRDETCSYANTRGPIRTLVQVMR
jgi:hypothetical protein